MDMIADVKCYHCGWISGRVAGQKGAARETWAFEARDGARTPLTIGRRLRCLRCNGPTFAEDLRPRALSEPLGATPQKALAGAA